MPTCPSCQTTQTKRKDGQCPNCGEEIIIYEGNWYSASIGSPTQALVSDFEMEMSRQTSTPTRRVVFSIPRGSERHKRELGFAKILLEKCDGDLVFAREILHEAFRGERFAWKQRWSIVNILGDFDIISAILIAKRQEREEKNRKEEDAYWKVMQKEDIFDNGE